MRTIQRSVMESMAGTAHKLRRIRREKLMTQEELANKAGVAPSTIVYIEMGEGKGTSEPRFSTLKKLAAALDIDPRTLIED